MAVASPTCILCRRPQLTAFEGLMVKGRYICNECERRIIVLDRGDPDYDYYKWGLKKIWCWPTNV
ncbi:Inhibitor of sigma-G Gin [Pelotomaculum schinkii]|uniref:Inhibitor of sigma-G Gin n=1 Tax=Pelotomaculum schinkii TaxID=78350 RepID=A0A4Y7RIC2_9FIRM|nr:Inhibitor of sigma-G Gin [Pelotomaculum schinkii]TEB11861.1 Inhibitor of sigma-G Gin [Pelotomaculum sp. FP]